MHISSLKDAKKVRPDMEGAEGVFKQIPLSREDGAPTFAFRVFTIEPGGHTAHHKHPFEHMNYVIDGNGTVIAEDKEIEIEKGDFVLVLPGETHQYRNTSRGKPLVIICAVPKEYE
jgi:quercetin dioxygenase-like cupin family protein